MKKKKIWAQINVSKYANDLLNYACHRKMWKVLLLKNIESCTLNDLLLKETLYGSYVSTLSVALKIISNDFLG